MNWSITVISVEEGYQLPVIPLRLMTKLTYQEHLFQQAAITIDLHLNDQIVRKQAYPHLSNFHPGKDSRLFCCVIRCGIWVVYFKIKSGFRLDTWRFRFDAQSSFLFCQNFLFVSFESSFNRFGTLQVWVIFEPGMLFAQGTKVHRVVLVFMHPIGCVPGHLMFSSSSFMNFIVVFLFLVMRIRSCPII